VFYCREGGVLEDPSVLPVLLVVRLVVVPCISVVHGAVALGVAPVGSLGLAMIFLDVRCDLGLKMLVGFAVPVLHDPSRRRLGL
jgi:hypothetical protein